jgi:TPR repeat protein
MRASGRGFARFVGACAVATTVVTCGWAAPVVRADGQAARNSAATAPLDIKASVAQCNTGDGKACNVVGAIYATGLQGIKLDLPQAFTFFQKSCNGSYATGCANLANAYYNGLGITLDRARAVQLYQQACDLSAVTACVDLGVVYRDGKVQAKNPTYAAKLFQRACDLSAAACASIASMYELGMGVPKDVPRAVSLYQRSCYATRSDSAEDIQRDWSRASCNVLTHLK